MKVFEELTLKLHEVLRRDALPQVLDELSYEIDDDQVRRMSEYDLANLGRELFERLGIQRSAPRSAPRSASTVLIHSSSLFDRAFREGIDYATTHSQIRHDRTCVARCKRSNAGTLIRPLAGDRWRGRRRRRP